MLSRFHRNVLQMPQPLDAFSWNPTDPAFRADPYPWYKALREQAPVLHHPEVGFVISRYTDIESLLRDPRLGVSTPSPWRELIAQHASPALCRLGELTLLFIDPPEHSRVRSLFAKTFTPRRVAELQPHLEKTVETILDRLEPLDEFDIMSEIAEPFPILSITHLLGVPDSDWTELHRWTTAITAFNELPVDFNALTGANEAATEFDLYCRSIIDERRSAPGDDLITALLASEEDGARLSIDEIVAMLILLLMAGHDTTKSLISSGLRELLRHPDQADLLRNDPSLITSAIEELLRFESPLHVASGGGRWASEPFELHGVTITPGTSVRLLLGSGNRDPDAFENPDRLDIQRAPKPHLAFGKGIHFCIGAALGRQEAQIVIPRVLTRFQDLEVTKDDLTWRSNFVTRQLTELPVRRATRAAS
ncbi:unannotated protein [freshwater metagenome]|uniref:Unannotated protein n=1 Tax=freshwater metagenome TaxID=449393 RepID=A0A6J6XZC5_9ZZZZ|nr:cytochrome P450 [Actinomycetota bacterium]